jgi:hypothetical protein
MVLEKPGFSLLVAATTIRPCLRVFSHFKSLNCPFSAERFVLWYWINTVAFATTKKALVAHRNGLRKA